MGPSIDPEHAHPDPVLGVDGCRAGWVGVLLDGQDYEVLVAPDLTCLVEGAGVRPAVIGLDMPLGLPDSGPRQSDLLARRRLPRGRKSSVFPTPSRPAVEATSYAEANAANRTALGRGLAHQTYHLVPKIAEAGAFVRAVDLRVVEIHPEVSFAAMDPTCVVPSKKSAAGAAAREAALLAHGLRPPPYAAGRGFARDDLLDAWAVAWSARRVATGLAESLPDPPERFSDGWPAAIWV